MHSIAVYTEKSPDLGNAYDVYWRTGIYRKGVCRCNITDSLPGGAGVAAELYALQYLLEYEQVLGEDRAGNAMTIAVSAPAIRKLARFKSDKKHLIPYSTFLTTRFGDAVIDVDKPRREKPGCWLPTKPDVIELDIAGPLSELVFLHGVGWVELTVHAIERFLERRTAAATAAAAWRQLRNIAKDPAVREIRLPERIREKKIARWGVTAKDFYHRGTGWHFIVVEGRSHPRLVSVLEREIKYPDLVAG